MHVGPETPNQPEVIAVIAELDAYQHSLHPADARYTLDLAVLVESNVLFAVVRQTNGVAIGCGAIVINNGYGEV